MISLRHYACAFIALLSFQITADGPIDLTIKIQIGGGFFAELHKVIQTIIHFEKQGFTNIDVDWHDEFFPYKDDPHENGWDIFFGPMRYEKKDATGFIQKVVINTTSEFHEMHDQVCTAPWVAYRRYLPYRQFIKQKLEQYAPLNPLVTNLVDQFYEKHMADKIAIGVHARIARAHAWLVPGKRLPTIEDYYAEVDKLLQRYEDQEVVIFVASDSHHAVAEFKKRYGDKVVHTDAYRAQTDQDPCLMYTSGEFYMQHKDLWHRDKHRTIGGLSTYWDCLLLSKCHHIIHTTSNLAFFATYYNPEIDSIYLPKGVPFKECRFAHDSSITNQFLNPA